MKITLEIIFPGADANKCDAKICKLIKEGWIASTRTEVFSVMTGDLLEIKFSLNRII